MYTTASWSVTYAIDARTGKQLWKYDPEVHRKYDNLACCDVVNRGAAFYKGKVIVGVLDGRLVALDANSGKVAWQTTTVDQTQPFTITGAPRIAKGKVIIGNGGAEYGVRGYVSAYDAETGKLAWRFYTVPGDPSKPQENKALEKALPTWNGTEWFKVRRRRHGVGFDRLRPRARTCSTSAPATARRGTATCAAPAAATTCTCARSSPSIPTTVSWCGTTRRRRPTPGTTRRCSR